MADRLIFEVIIDDKGTPTLKKVRDESKKTKDEMDKLGDGAPWQSIAKGVGTAMAAYVALRGTIQLVGSTVQTLTGIFWKGIEAIDKLKINTSALAAILSSQAKDKGDLAARYKEALPYAKEANLQLEMMSAKAIGTAENLQTMNQFLAQGGVAIDYNNKLHKETAIALANIIHIYSATHNTDLQYIQETRSVLDGTIKMQSRVAMYLDAQMKGRLKENIELWKKQGTVLENLFPYIKSFIAAGADLAKTWKALAATLEYISNKLLRGGMQEAYDWLIEKATFIKDLLIDENGQLTEHARIIKEDIAGAWRMIKTSFIDPIIWVFQKIAEYRWSRGSELSKIDKELDSIYKRWQELNKVNPSKFPGVGDVLSYYSDLGYKAWTDAEARQNEIIRQKNILSKRSLVLQEQRKKYLAGEQIGTGVTKLPFDIEALGGEKDSDAAARKAEQRLQDLNNMRDAYIRLTKSAEEAEMAQENTRYKEVKRKYPETDTKMQVSNLSLHLATQADIKKKYIDMEYDQRSDFEERVLKLQGKGIAAQELAIDRQVTKLKEKWQDNATMLIDIEKWAAIEKEAIWKEMEDKLEEQAVLRGKRGVARELAEIDYKYSKMLAGIEKVEQRERLFTIWKKEKDGLLATKQEEAAEQAAKGWEDSFHDFFVSFATETDNIGNTWKQLASSLKKTFIDQLVKPVSGAIGQFMAPVSKALWGAFLPELGKESVREVNADIQGPWTTYKEGQGGVEQVPPDYAGAASAASSLGNSTAKALGTKIPGSGGASIGQVAGALGAAYTIGTVISNTIGQLTGNSRGGDIAGGVVGGAVAGAIVGSVVPVIGTAVGAIIGAVAGGLIGWATHKEFDWKGVKKRVDEAQNTLVEKLNQYNLGNSSFDLEAYHARTSAQRAHATDFDLLGIRKPNFVPGSGYKEGDDKIWQAWLEKVAKKLEAIVGNARTVLSAALSDAFKAPTVAEGMTAFAKALKTSVLDVIQKAITESFLNSWIIKSRLMPIMAELDKGISEGKTPDVDAVVNQLMDMLDSNELKYYTKLLIGLNLKWSKTLGLNNDAPSESTLAPLATQPATYTEIPAYQHGSWNTPGGLAQLHPGEMVLSAGVAEQVRSGNGESPIYIDFRNASFGSSAKDTGDAVLDGIEKAHQNKRGSRRPVMSRTQTAGVRIVN